MFTLLHVIEYPKPYSIGGHGGSGAIQRRGHEGRHRLRAARGGGVGVSLAGGAGLTAAVTPIPLYAEAPPLHPRTAARGG